VTLTLIVAADEDDTIGRDGALPWHLPEDLRRFKRLTVGHVVVAGRVTHDGIVDRLGHPLPERTTVVVTRNTARVDSEAVRHAASLDEALALARRLAGGREVFIIGGADIYAQSLSRVDRVELTRVHDRVGGDRRLPPGWLDGFLRTGGEGHDGYSFETYQRALYYFGNHRTAEQLDQMRQLEEAGTCLFCPGQRSEAIPILQRSPHWTVQPNSFPYRGSRLHLLLVPDEHVIDLVDLSAAAQADLFAVLASLRSEYQLSFYSLVARNGDPRFTGGTIRHLHLHLLQGDVDDPDHEPVRTKLSSRPPD
jgi:dihydrofolate reductase/diadenosine tetraphosphate (Ap4A) HIT family hydrolase